MDEGIDGTQMNKRVVVINDEIGTMALGFSKAGYEISAICVEQANKNSLNILRENWGDVVRAVDLDTSGYEEVVADLNVEFIAGKILMGMSFAGNSRGIIYEDKNISQAVRLLEITRPKYFLFHCNRVSDSHPSWQHLYNNFVSLGYTIEYKCMETHLFTGLPVAEKVCFVFGTMDANSNQLELLKCVDTLNYSLDFFCEKSIVKDEWYYKINQQLVAGIEKKNDTAVLCWNRKNYKEVEHIAWNYLRIPLVIQGDSIRKITHREVARLKGIPDEYRIDVKNRSWLYQKLMYTSTVQLVQQIVSAVSVNEEGEYFQRREISKGEQFENIMISFFDKKGIKNAGTSSDVNSNIDFQFEMNEKHYCFDFKIYRNNFAVEDRLISLCEKRYKYEHLDKKNTILVIGNIVGKQRKKVIEDEYKVAIWDVENLLWILDEFPQIKSDFIALLSFSVSDIVPEKPDQYIFDQTVKEATNIALQEKLRKVQPGDAFRAYETLCEEIVRYLFSENLEFFKAQKTSNDGLYRFDYCAKIKHGNTNEFFDTIKNFFQTKYIVFEFKNYKDEITQEQIYTTEKYLYEKALRKVAIILSRKGVDKNAQKAARGSLRESGKLIICLSDENVNKLIDMKNNKEDPGDYLEALLDEMLLDLEK